MVYIPLEYKDLHDNTSELQEIFNKESNRYDPPSYEDLCKKVRLMERDYRQRVKEKPNRFFAKQVDSTRFKEISCITHLLDDFQKTASESAEQDKAQNILLGALFYRRRAIERAYEGSVSYCLNLSEPRSSALYLTIEEMLMLEPRKKNELDPKTVTTCCAAYRKRLDDLGAVVGSVYICESEVDFFQQLDLLISKTQGASRDVTEQMEHLVAIQSFDDFLFKSYTDVCTGLVLFSSALSKELIKKDGLSRKGMMRCLEGVELSPLVKFMIKFLVPAEMSLNKESCCHFVEDIGVILAEYSQHALLGAYVTVLKKTSPEPSKLTTTLNLAIDAASLDNTFDEDDKTRLKALTLLGHYLKLPGIRDLDFSNWRSYNSFKREVEKQAADLQTMSEINRSIVM